MVTITEISAVVGLLSSALGLCVLIYRVLKHLQGPLTVRDVKYVWCGGDHYLSAKIVARTADIWNLRVQVEVFIKPTGKNDRTRLPYGRVVFELAPIGNNRNPLNVGEVITFQVALSKYKKNGRIIDKAFDEYLPKLPLRCASLCIYCSTHEERPLKRIRSRSFLYQLDHFFETKLKVRAPLLGQLMLWLDRWRLENGYVRRRGEVSRLWEQLILGWNLAREAVTAYRSYYKANRCR